MSKFSYFRYFPTSPGIIRLVVMMYIRFSLSLRNVENLQHERGIDISHESVRFWWNRFGPIFAAEIRRNRVRNFRAYFNWQWHLDEVFVRINDETHYLWCPVDRIRTAGDDPSEYIDVAFKVSERKYTAWPEHLRRDFEPARTVKTGTLKIEIISQEVGQ